LQKDGVSGILKKDGRGDGMCNVAGSQCFKKESENNPKVSFICVCALITILFADHSLFLVSTRYFAAEFGGRLVVPQMTHHSPQSMGQTH
jgi:hypothetical protein